uniref:Uncharacterized protein n=1 Tax=Triticum urartu TaxID=4572 RepID=A0A8R7UYC2_TRIUA
MMAGCFHSSSTCPAAAIPSTSSSSSSGRLPTRRCGTRMSMQSREMPLEVAFLSTSSEVSQPRTRRHKSPVPFIEIWVQENPAVHVFLLLKLGLFS